jgi:hypothetical protein
MPKSVRSLAVVGAVFSLISSSALFARYSISILEFYYYTGINSILPYLGFAAMVTVMDILFAWSCWRLKKTSFLGATVFAVIVGILLNVFDGGVSGMIGALMIMIQLLIAIFGFSAYWKRDYAQRQVSTTLRGAESSLEGNNFRSGIGVKSGDDNLTEHD